MPLECLIHFDDNPAKIFYAGQSLSGRVDVTFREPKTVRGIYIEISGNAHSHWTEGGGDTKKSYTGAEPYLSERAFFVGGLVGDTNVPPGQYQYGFHCKLSEILPTSLEGDVGYIRYQARVVLEIALCPDEEFVETFTVIKPLNLNKNSMLRLPAFEEKYKRFYPFCFCCCFPSSPLHLVARIPVSGYTPGQTINVEIDVDNKSRIDADFSVQLIKVTTFYIYASSPKNRVETVVVCEKLLIGKSPPNSNESFRVAMIVPPLPPSDETTSNICKFRYVLRIIGVVNFFHIDPFVDIPITIGSHPILDYNPVSPLAEVEAGYNLPLLPMPPVTQQLLPNPMMHVPMPTEPPSGGFPEPGDSLLPSQNETATIQSGSQSGIPLYPVTIPSADVPNDTEGVPRPASVYPMSFVTSTLRVQAIHSIPPMPSAPPCGEDKPPTYEQATIEGEVAGKSFKPNYQGYGNARSCSSPSNEKDE